MKKASARAFRGGAAGFAAGVIQVLSFMWLRTAMNYQYAKGGNMGGAISALWKEGGIPRFYKGLQFAIIQNPLQFQIPEFFLNRRKDFKTGKTMHLSAQNFAGALRNDLERMKKIRRHRGLSRNRRGRGRGRRRGNECVR